MKKIIDDSALVAALNEIDHEVNMMGFSDEDSALDDWEFSGPRIRRAVDTMRNIISNAPAAPMEGFKSMHICADLTDNLLKGTAEPGKDAAENFRQGQDPDKHPHASVIPRKIELGNNKWMDKYDQNGR